MDNEEPISETTSPEDETSSIFSEIDARVLGCLMEKQQTTPDQYPLTLNSLLLACNQKSSREPKMSLKEGEVGHCLRELENKGYIRVDMGARSSRYEHRMITSLHIDKSLQAILTVMMLRGPQTVNELLTRTQRTGLFTENSEIENALDRLIERAEPLAKLIPRQAGQREDRYAHLLCGEPKIDIVSKSAERKSASSLNAEHTANLEARVEALEEQVKELQAFIDELIRD